MLEETEGKVECEWSEPQMHHSCTLDYDMLTIYSFIPYLESGYN